MIHTTLFGPQYIEYTDNTYDFHRLYRLFGEAGLKTNCDVYTQSEQYSEPMDPDGMYIWSIDMPGYDIGDINVDVVAGNLTVKANNKIRGVFSRSHQLPTDIDESSIAAKLKLGILTVTYTRKTAKKIQVSVG